VQLIKSAPNQTIEID
jgi:hypothetical protein